MKALIIGGRRHGEWQDVLDGSTAWVDIATADTYRIRKVNWGINDMMTGEMKELYLVRLAVHPDLTGPGEAQQVTHLLSMLAMSEFVRAHGEKEKTPDTPAELTEPSAESVE